MLNCRTIVLVVGLTLSSTCYAQNLEQERPQAEDGSDPQVEQSSEAAESHSASNVECPPDREDRQSELCAQWKAADSAADAARWAMIGTFLALIGGFGLFWQIRLTRQTLDAQIAADRPVVVCNNVELRLSSHQSEEYPVQLNVDWFITNLGSTPAFVESVCVSLRPGTEPPGQFSDSVDLTGVPLQPGGKTKSAGRKRFLFSKSAVATVLETEQISAIGFVRYHNVAGLRWETRFALRIKIDSGWKRVECFPVPGPSPTDMRI